MDGVRQPGLGPLPVGTAACASWITTTARARYDETERAIQEQLGLDEELVGYVRPEDDPDALIVVPSAGHEGLWSGPYAAGGVWAAFAGTGTITVNGEERAIDWPGARPLIEHEHHTESVLDLQVGNGVECLAVHFTPGLVPPGR